MPDRKDGKPRKRRSGTTSHVIRTADGNYTSLKLTRKLAMAAFCTECMGFESDPQDCTAKVCPLFPFRVRTQRTRIGKIKDNPYKKKGDPF